MTDYLIWNKCFHRRARDNPNIASETWHKISDRMDFFPLHMISAILFHYVPSDKFNTAESIVHAVLNDKIS